MREVLFLTLFFLATCIIEVNCTYDNYQADSYNPQKENWAAWSEWGECGVEFKRLSFRTRSCLSLPCPSHLSKQAKRCNINMWTTWTAWSTCDPKSGSLSVRHRQCKPTPGMCGERPYKQGTICQPVAPLEGHWTEWSEWGPCGAEGPGFSSSDRSCMPAGSRCDDLNKRTKRCYGNFEPKY